MLGIYEKTPFKKFLNQVIKECNGANACQIDQTLYVSLSSDDHGMKCHCGIFNTFGENLTPIK